MSYVDPSTGRTYPISEARWCGEGGHYLNLASAPGLGRRDIDSARHSVWRYARGLLVDVADAVSLGEGWTPLVAGDWEGSPVHYKLEFMMPTGSFKDRGMTVMISYLRSRGITRVLEDSSGNAGASLSAYAAAAGLDCRILVPETASYPKIAQIAACGADVVTIKGSRQDVAEAALRQSTEIFYASHNWQPFFVEGIKTLAYELWEQLEFRAPDNLVVPLGYGSNVLGAERGFDELTRQGEIAVSEAEIVEALRGLARRGLYVEPTSATAAAGLTRLVAEGVIRPDEATVLVLTGSGLKASATTGELLGLRARSE